MIEIAASIPNATAAGPFGSNLVSRDYVESGVPVIRGQNLSSRWIGGDFVFVSPEKAATLRTNTARPGDIVFTQRGTLGQVALVPPGPFPLYVISQSQMKLTVDPAKADSGYVYYACTSEDFIRQVHDNAVAAGVPHINLGTLRGLGIPLPPLGTQKAIAHALAMLDDRIDLLRQTNATLEAIAEALFKSWFVDFDPVHAKAEGRDPEAMDATTAALFPSEFEESELGPIPKGWHTVSFEEVATRSKDTINPLHEPDTQFEHYSIPAFDAGQLPADEQGKAIKSNKTLVPSDAVLVSKLNPHIPRIWAVGQVGEGAVCSTEFLVWIPQASASSAFVYCLASSHPFNSAMRQLVTGTSNSHQRVKPAQLGGIRVCAVSDHAMEAFASAAGPLLQKILDNRQQAATLSKLRDTLLPRLISGKLRLPEARELAEAEA
jgi:type I restriction enzyme S subunit